ncbi:MAG: NAD(P)/FAD-dependent oxidoreductase [Chloroflexi bacterium]|nr:MAG: NAD(P)/FAD-dependent oxidoreductase [Chloroflexota bacterium]
MTDAGPARDALHRVVIVGGGFGGLYAARELGRDRRIDLTLVDRRNFHLFQPLLYQVATGALSPGEIAQPLRSILRRQARTSVILGEATGLDVARREVLLSDGGPIPYDSLVVSTGARHAYFGHDAWAPFAPGLKTVEDAIEIRRRILIAFEAAEREADPAVREAWMTFAIVGAGPTGVELAGAIGEIAHDTLRRDFRSIHPEDARIVLVELADRILATFPEGLARKAVRSLERLGVAVRTSTTVVGIDEAGVAARVGDREERIPTRTVLWAAGVQATSFGRELAKAAGVEADRAGRITVADDLTLPDHPEIFVVGDLAVMRWKGGREVPGVAQGAIQSGRQAARNIRARLDGRATEPFRYKDKGNLATIGRGKAIADLGRFRRFSGFPAWVLWLGVHILYLIGFANRLVVLVRWAWSFVTHGRSTRLITGTPLLPEIREPEPPA